MFLALIVSLSACGAQGPQKHPFYAYGETPGENPELIRRMQNEDLSGWVEYHEKLALKDQDPRWNSSLPSQRHSPTTYRDLQLP